MKLNQDVYSYVKKGVLLGRKGDLLTLLSGDHGEVLIVKGKRWEVEVSKSGKEFIHAGEHAYSVRQENVTT